MVATEGSADGLPISVVKHMPCIINQMLFYFRRLDMPTADSMVPGENHALEGTAGF